PGRPGGRPEDGRRMTAHIECTDLVRIFSADGVEVQALQGLNLRVDRGELTAVVGASGSGKSTLLAILSGLDVPTAGSARVAGHDLFAMSARERTRYRRHTVGFVWQQTGRNLLPYYTAAQNIALALAVARRPAGERQARVDELDRKSTRLNSSHVKISYAVFC